MLNERLERNTVVHENGLELLVLAVQMLIIGLYVGVRALCFD